MKRRERTPWNEDKSHYPALHTNTVLTFTRKTDAGWRFMYYLCYLKELRFRHGRDSPQNPHLNTAYTQPKHLENMVHGTTFTHTTVFHIVITTSHPQLQLPDKYFVGVCVSAVCVCVCDCDVMPSSFTLRSVFNS